MLKAEIEDINCTAYSFSLFIWMRCFVISINPRSMKLEAEIYFLTDWQIGQIFFLLYLLELKTLPHINAKKKKGLFLYIRVLFPEMLWKIFFINIPPFCSTQGSFFFFFFTHYILHKNNVILETTKDSLYNEKGFILPLFNTETNQK